MWLLPKLGGPQYRHQNIMTRTMGMYKSTPYFGRLQCLQVPAKPRRQPFAPCSISSQMERRTRTPTWMVQGLLGIGSGELGMYGTYATIASVLLILIAVLIATVMYYSSHLLLFLFLLPLFLQLLHLFVLQQQLSYPHHLSSLNPAP